MAHISELRMKSRWKYEQNKQDSKHINTHQIVIEIGTELF